MEPLIKCHQNDKFSLNLRPGPCACQWRLVGSVTMKQWQYLDPQPDNLANDLKFIFQIQHQK